MYIKGVKDYKNDIEKINNNKLVAGNYICKESSNKNPMLVIYYDIVDDCYKDYYKKLYEKNKTNKFKGVYYQSMIGSSFKFYKNMITAIEKSNNIKIDIENGFDSEILKGKLFLGRFGEEEYISKDDKIKSITLLRYIAPINNEKKLPILKIKKIKG